ncbi:hypothetical protein [Streptomyces sp. ITFR-16]|uniref:hypothetical protein n=1 Tax=Streptomyces sp. ITFR-16 TaxID=3075198 RepID=UPI00288BBAF4|nr:hypothetical protein [Streptomyces sp. ITFR-16]WNI26454.1 hypothetical protein RLT58_33270 [Streptomyces sp. ITFR-16]
MTNDADRTTPAPLSTPAAGGPARSRPLAPDTAPGTAAAPDGTADRTHTSHETPAPPAKAPARPSKAPAAPGPDTPSGATGTLLPTGDHDKFALRLQQAVTDFVESPQRAVEEAESTFEAVVEGLTHALDEHRRTLRTSAGQDTEPGARTEELRITLQHYRDITERLLKV